VTVYLAFFLSGFPALLYQLIWQRSLFTIYGVNIESITVVVTAFMLGLGLGSLMGGAISKMKRVNPLAAFGIFELGIGAFGVMSPWLFELVSSYTLGASALQTFVITFALVLIPTLLMGATLPLLVAYLVRRFHNVGVSVGVLYFVNTLGAALVCFLAVLWLFGTFGKTGTLHIAAAINVAVGGVALVAYWRTRARMPVSASTRAEAVHDAGRVGATAATAMRFPLALIVIAVIGYISLSYEILWIRVYAFQLHGRAAAFPLLLGAFLAGIAFGSWAANRYCRHVTDLSNRSHLKHLAYFVFLANGFAFLVIPAMAHACAVIPGALFAVSLVLVGAGAALLGATLPLVSHFAIRPDDKAGAGLSYLYLANIVGAAAGSLITGFILMDHWSLEEIGVFLACVGFVLSAILLLTVHLKGAQRSLGLAGMAAAGVLVFVTAQPLFDQTYERLLFKRAFTPQTRFAAVVETKSGVVTVTDDGIVFGGGAYDGKFNTNIVDDSNGIVRAYFASALHPAPKTVLMIGLASGSWAQVVANNPAVEEMTIVEINPGYRKVLSMHPDVASLPTNPKVKLVIDDGRRWLARNPQARFDLVIMNTTAPWRAQVTNLFSIEFLELVRAHLNPGGILFYNAFNTPEVQKTATIAFPYVMRIRNCIAASESPIHIDKARWVALLSNQKIDGVPVLPTAADEQTQHEIRKVLARAEARPQPAPDLELKQWDFETKESIVARTADRSHVTDDNMITEWPREYILARLKGIVGSTQ
jgi:spermidine synthase